jgi:hypothetical protein
MTRCPSLSSLALVLFGVVCVAAGSAHAQRRGVPREAVDACDGREDGDDCEVRLGGRDVAGTCMAPPDGELVCVLDRGAIPPPAHRHDDALCDAWDEDACEGR